MDFISPDIPELDRLTFMQEALRESEAAGQAGELPIGAVLVIDGEIVSRGRARHKESASQIRHAELNALLDGGPRLYQHYERAVLFTTVEPCPMCLGAAVMADVPHILFALYDRAVYSGLSVETNPYIKRHIRSYQGGVLGEEAAAIVGRYNPEFLLYISRTVP